jgi:uncharacterized membrane protein YesL
MAGFFGFFDYTKPGPGIDKDEPQKAAVFVFMDIYFRKFWNLIKINLLYFIFSIPTILLFIIASVAVIPQISAEASIDLIMRVMIGAIFFVIPVITCGPVQAGFTYLIRNYAREEHAFIFSDFKEHALKNFKQGMIVSAIDFIVFMVVMVDLRIYFVMKDSNFLMMIPTILIIMAFVIFIMMHMYIYPMMVTFKLTIKELYKNAFVFAMMKFLPNLGILILCYALVLASFWFTPIGLILFPLLTLSTISLITNFYVYPKLKKYIIDKVENKIAIEENTLIEDEEKATF